MRWGLLAILSPVALAVGIGVAEIQLRYGDRILAFVEGLIG